MMKAFGYDSSKLPGGPGPDGKSPEAPRTVSDVKEGGQLRDPQRSGRPCRRADNTNFILLGKEIQTAIWISISTLLPLLLQKIRFIMFRVHMPGLTAFLLMPMKNRSTSALLRILICLCSLTKKNSH